jgi:molecular chaperone GrpE
MSSDNSQDRTDLHSAEAAVGEGGVGGTTPAGSADEVQRLTDELQSANDRALRAQAELENFRKRVRREVDEERRYAALPLISDLLPVIDNLDRAVQTGESTASADELLQGVKMVHTLFLSTLERHHCVRLGEVGEPFDPHRHQAIAQEPSDKHPAGAVTRVARHGYQIHDRVVRPAEVLVSTGAPQ